MLFQNLKRCPPNADPTTYCQFLCEQLKSCRLNWKNRKSKPLFEQNSKTSKKISHQQQSPEQHSLKSVHQRVIRATKNDYFLEKEEERLNTTETNKTIWEKRKNAPFTNRIDKDEWQNHFEKLLSSNQLALVLPQFPTRHLFIAVPLFQHPGTRTRIFQTTECKSR